MPAGGILSLLPPEPTAERWQPLRAGLVDVFLYDVEEFHFRDGNLLLRGNNGTGKSKVLAMLLPFLLDGEVSPHRVEPDGDPKKRMEWNLLMGGRHPHPDRLGYTWLEFGRRAADGTVHYRTIGAGIKAVSGRGSVTTWFFLTSQRIGVDLALVGPTRTALTRDRLIDALGGAGQVFDTASRYRRALDETFFDLGEERYDALVNLLIQLRQPQLSKKPDEKLLSSALTEALPPLDQAVVADTAEAFRSLESEREDLAGFVEARDAATGFLAHYRRYAQMSARRRAREPRMAQSAYESASRQLAEVRTEREAAETAEAEVAREQASAEDQIVRLSAEKETLAARPEMDQGRELDRLDVRARDTRRAAERAAAELAAATTQLADRRRRAEHAETRLRAAADRLDLAATKARRAAEPAGVLPEHTAATDGLVGPTASQASQLSQTSAHALRSAERATLDAAGRREAAVAHVAQLVGEHERAIEHLRGARMRHDEARSAADTAAETAQAARVRCGEEGTALVGRTRRHLDAAVELRLPDVDQVLADLADWVEDSDGANPVEVAVAAAAREAARGFGADDARLATRAEAAETSLQLLETERADLADGGQRPPPAPHTRDPATRSGRPGAPLWQLVEPLDGRDDDVAGLEAALEAAGLLDAWVTPEGQLLDAGTHDTVVLPAPRPGGYEGVGVGVDVGVGVGVGGGAHLGQALRPAVDREDPQAAAVTDEVVAAVLAGIGLIGLSPQDADARDADARDADAPEADTWVATDGRFRVGRLDGAWAKPAASYLGHAAREQARRRRLAEIDSELAELAAVRTEIDQARAEVRRRRQVLDDEAAGLPSTAPLRAALAAAARADTERAAADRVLAAADAALAAATTAANRARETLTSSAGELGLPAVAEELDAVRAAVVAYRVSLADLWPTIRERDDADARRTEAAGDLAEAADIAAQRADLREAAEREHLTAATAHDTMLRTVGSAVAEVQRRLGEATRALAAAQAANRELGRRRLELARELGVARGREAELAANVEAAGANRREAAERLRRFAAGGLLGIALPDVETPDPAKQWAPDPAVRLARQVEAALVDVDVHDGDKAWERTQKLIAGELATLQEVLSRHGHQATASITDDGWVVSTFFRNQETSPSDLAGALDAEVADRERLLNEREREILENHLVSEVASHLQELISDAERQVAKMNAELAERPTSTGMKLRFDWRPGPDAPAGLPAARERLLRQVADAWSLDDRDAVGEFLQAQITRERQNDEGGTWLEHLSRALDYRRWHVFAVQRYSDGQWRSASGPASGGERALAVTIPLFAAASSHYRSAGNPHAPRLVMLDEAFAGVDDDARASCLGLLAEFNMDVVMTSEREWGCYRTVPGLAISQLSRRDGIDAVLVTRWEWDGRERRPAGAVRIAAPRDPARSNGAFSNGSSNGAASNGSSGSSNGAASNGSSNGAATNGFEPDGGPAGLWE